ncbi:MULTISPECIES: type II CRISPR-associated endonuclease Cas1 [Corynebacterium]|uniref:type II CRISPR-associated endonuclease Cas1 n=1 Tax=Corynebacterium TaxID=1716 RepID=UPI0025805962|nr:MULTISPECIES: type II CRISPR-associated endonuclease Cas1 [Corynebacterium]
MNSGWRVLDCIALKGSLRYKRGQLVIHKYDERTDIVFPLAQIAVVLIGIQTSVSGAVITKLSEYDIALLVCDWRSVPTAGAIPWRDHTRIGVRHRSQAELSIPRKKQAWSKIVSSKISGQHSCLLQTTGKTSPHLLRLSQKVRSGDPENFEAQAARLYWPLVSGNHSFSRLPGAGISGWNSALDYGYTLLRGYGIRAISGAGLAGALGVFHHGRGNAFALVDDLMEPFRPMVDQLVFTRVDHGEELNASVKQYLSKGLSAAFDNSGKTLPTVFNEFAQQYGLYVEGDIRELSVPRWKGLLDAGEGK